QITHAAGADTNEHFHKFRAGDGEERNACLTRYGFRQKRLSGSRRTNEQYAFRNTRAKLDELLGFLEELYNFSQFLFRFVCTRNILKCHSWMFAAEHAGARFTERHRSVVRALRLTKNKPKHAHHQQDRQQVHNEAAERTLPYGRSLNFDLDSRQLVGSHAEANQLIHKSRV